MSRTWSWRRTGSWWSVKGLILKRKMSPSRAIKRDKRQSNPKLVNVSRTPMTLPSSATWWRDAAAGREGWLPLRMCVPPFTATFFEWLLLWFTNSPPLCKWTRVTRLQLAPAPNSSLSPKLDSRARLANCFHCSTLVSDYRWSKEAAIKGLCSKQDLDGPLQTARTPIMDLTICYKFKN